MSQAVKNHEIGECAKQVSREHHRTAAKAIGKPPEQPEKRDRQGWRYRHINARESGAHPWRVRKKKERVDLARADYCGGASDEPEERNQHDLQVFPLIECLPNESAGGLASRFYAKKQGRFPDL